MNESQPKETSIKLISWWWLLFFLQAVGFSSVVTHLNLVNQKIHRFPLLIQIIIFVILLLFYLIFLGYIGYYFTSSRNSIRAYFSFSYKKLILCFSPLILGVLTWLGHFYFLHEFRPTLILGVISGIFFLLIIIKPISLSPNKKQKIVQYWLRLPPKKISIFIFCLLLLVYNLISLGIIFSPQPFTGDEPHYLLLTTSLLHDKDTNLTNNILQKDYLEFYPGELRPHTYPGRKKDSSYSRHALGLPFLLLPSFAIGEKLSQKITDPSRKRTIIIWCSRFPMTVISALLISGFFLFAIKIFGQKIQILWLTLFWGLSPPFIFYSHLIYPEIPIALFLLICWGLLIIKKPADLSLTIIFICSSLLSLYPWLGIKYLPLTTLGFLLWGRKTFLFIKEHRSKIVSALFNFLTPFLLSGTLLCLYMWKIYGSISPISFYRGISSGGNLEHFFHLSILNSLRCGLGYFLDQRAGLIPYNPLFFFSLAGALILFCWRPKFTLLLSSPALLYWSFTSLAFYWGGYCPPGRTLLPLIWIFWLYNTAVLTKDKRLPLSKKIIVALFFIVTTGITVGSLQDPGLLYYKNLSFPFSQEGLLSHSLQNLSNHFLDFTKIVPSLSNSQFFNPFTLFLWLVSWVGITAFFASPFPKNSVASLSSPVSLNFTSSACKTCQSKQKTDYPERLRQQNTDSWRSSIMAVFFTLILICIGVLYSYFDLHLQAPYSNLHLAPALIYPQDTHAFGPEEGGFWIKGRKRANFLLRVPQKISAISLELSSQIPMVVDIKQGFHFQKVKISSRHPTKITLTSSSLTFFPWKKDFIYALSLKATRGFYPFRQSKPSTDRRFLGVFWRISSISYLPSNPFSFDP